MQVVDCNLNRRHALAKWPARFALASILSLFFAILHVNVIAAEGLQVEVRDPVQFKLGDEPDLEISLKNSSNSPIRIRDFANHRHWMIQYIHFVTIRDGKEMPGPNGALLDLAFKPPPESEWRKLLPGEAMSFHTHRDMGIGLDALRPGDFIVEIQVWAEEDGHYVSSNPFSVRVVP
jgi:hypothetical protein